jgi:predicted MFS family arabinose efflux permease
VAAATGGQAQARQRLDLRGLALLSSGIAAFLYGRSEAGSRGFGSLGASIAALAGLVLIALHCWHASGRAAGALIDISLLRRRAFAAAAGLNLLLMGGLYGPLILIPLYYQLVRHDTSLQTGLLLAPQGIGAALAMPLAGRVADKAGARGIASAGIAVTVLGMLAYTQVGPRTSHAYLAGALLMIGLGLGAIIGPSMAAAFQVLSRAETPRATSALNAIQSIAGAAGTAAFAIILSARDHG